MVLLFLFFFSFTSSCSANAALLSPFPSLIHPSNTLLENCGTPNHVGSGLCVYRTYNTPIPGIFVLSIARLHMSLILPGLEMGAYSRIKIQIYHSYFFPDHNLCMNINDDVYCIQYIPSSEALVTVQYLV